MTLRTGVCYYTLQKHIDVLSFVNVVRESDGHSMALVIVNLKVMGEFLRRDRKDTKPHLGMPRYAAFSRADTLLIYPAPDRDMDAHVVGMVTVEQ